MIRRCLGPVVMLLCLVLFAGAAAAQDKSIENIQGAGVLRVGMADSGVMQSKDPATGEWRGFNVDMANKVAKVLGVKLEIVDATWNSLIPGLLAGKYDIAFVDMFPTAARAVTIDFTRDYATHGWQVIVAANSPYKSIEELNSPDVTVSALTGSIEEAIRPEILPNAKTKPLVTENLSSMVQEVIAGRAQATMLEPYNIESMEKQNPDMASQIRVLNDKDHLVRPTGIAYGVRPGSEHLLHFLNSFIEEEQTTGESNRLFSQWLGRVAN